MKTTTLIRLPEVLRRTALCRTSLYTGVKDGTFPTPVKIGARAVAWRDTEVDAWIATRQPRDAARETSGIPRPWESRGWMGG